MIPGTTRRSKSRRRFRRPLVATLTGAGTLLAVVSAQAQGESSEELAKKLQNPVASLISLPLQSNWDFGVGHADAMRFTLNRSSSPSGGATMRSAPSGDPNWGIWFTVAFLFPK